MLSALLYKFLPHSLFVRLRGIYRGSIRRLHKPLNEKQFREILSEKLHIKAGSTVFIHSSVDFLNTEFDTLRLLEILVESVGSEGSLVFPCWHFSYRAEDYLRSGNVFDVRRSPSVMGMLSEMARRWPGAKRSLHPTNSIVAIGKYAEEITKDHHKDIYPCGELSPYFKIKELGGTIAGVGVDCMFMSFVHCVEDVMKEKFPLKTRMDEMFTAGVKDFEGNLLQVKTLAAHPMICNNDIRAFARKHITPAACENIYVKGNRFFRADAKLLFAEMEKLARKRVTIYTRSW